MPKPRHLILALALSAAVGLSGCAAINPDPVSTAGRADMTAAPPKSYSDSLKQVDEKVPAKKAKPPAKKKAPATKAPARKSPPKQSSSSWVSVTDARTGVRFSLPRQVSAEEEAGPLGLRMRTYSVEDGGQMVSVLVGELGRRPTHDALHQAMASYRQEVGRTFGQAPEVSEEVTGSAGDRPLVSATLTFHENGEVAVARVRMVGERTSLVVYTTISFGAPQPTVRQRADALLGRVAS